jgi:hypothetical protein
MIGIEPRSFFSSKSKKKRITDRKEIAAPRAGYTGNSTQGSGGWQPVPWADRKEAERRHEGDQTASEVASLEDQEMRSVRCGALGEGGHAMGARGQRPAFERAGPEASLQQVLPHGRACSIFLWTHAPASLYKPTSHPGAVVLCRCVCVQWAVAVAATAVPLRFALVCIRFLPVVIKHRRFTSRVLTRFTHRN